MEPNSTAWLVATAVLSAIVIRAFRRSRTSKRLPPGPPGLPVIGNLHQLTQGLWLKLAQWRKEYGPVVYANAAGQPMIILGTHKAASDLLDKRARIYSDRPRTIVAGEILSGGLVLPFARYDESWKQMRKVSHEAMSTQSSKGYTHFEEGEAAILVAGLLRSPEKYMDHIRRTSNSVLLSIIYGSPPKLESNDPLIVALDQMTEKFVVAALPGTFLVEVLPWMMYLPKWLCPWRQNAEHWHQVISSKLEELFDDVANRGDTADQRSCIVSSLIDAQANGVLTREESIWTAGSLYLAGSETSASQMMWFTLAALLHPQAQRRAQEELDSVVGKHRMPTFQDYDHLPYIRAFVKEVVRWRPGAPMGIPHYSGEDDEYEGFFIPKGATVVANTWGLNHDVDVYGPDAEEFRPERFIGPNGQLQDTLSVDTKGEGHVAYGFGRRICVGRVVSNQTLFIEVASVLWAFNILPQSLNDDDGKADIVLPNPDAYIDRGIALRPEPFNCRFVPRFAEVEDVVEEARDRYMKVW